MVRLILAEQLGCRTSPRLILEIDIGERLSVVVTDAKARGLFLDGPGLRKAAISHARGFRLIEVLSRCRETHSRYLWNTECECRAGSKCAVVSEARGGGLATLHLRHLSAVPGRSYGEWILHSKLHLPALLAIHSAALARRVIFPNPPLPPASLPAHSDF
jgi:hypothetical protein